jgi:hypothetical protein
VGEDPAQRGSALRQGGSAGRDASTDVGKDGAHFSGSDLVIKGSVGAGVVVGGDK